MADSVTYNSYTLTNLQAPFTFTRTGKEFTFSQSFLVTAASDAAFTTATQAAETALNVKDGRLQVTWGDQSNHFDFNPASSAHTGMKVYGSVRKIGDATKDLQRSRLYVFECMGLLPASELGYSNGGFEVSIEMAVDAARRPIFTFRGEYRGEGSDNALTTYTASSGGAKDTATTWLQTHAATIAGDSTFDGDNPLTNYELIREIAPSEDKQHVVTYTLVYRWRGIPEKADGTASSDYIIDSCTMNRVRDKKFGIIKDAGVGAAGNGAGGGGGGTRTTPGGAGGLPPGGGGGGANRGGETPYTFLVQFEVDGDFTAVNYDGSAGTSIKSLYEDTIKGFLWQHLQDVWNPEQNAPILLISESTPSITSNNRLSVAWLVETADQSGLYDLLYVTSLTDDHRLVHVKRADGEEHTYDSYSPGIRRTITQEAQGTMEWSRFKPTQVVPRLTPQYGSGGIGWELLREVTRKDSYLRYTTEGEKVEMIDFAVTREYLWRGGGTQQGGGGGTVTPG